MFGRWQKRNQDEMPDQDERLDKLLKLWQGIEPRPGFEEAVWRQINVRERTVPGSAFHGGVFAWLLPRPAWSMAVAVVAAVLLGVVGGLISRRQTTPDNSLNLLIGSRTLAGSYLVMKSGGGR